MAIGLTPIVLGGVAIPIVLIFAAIAIYLIIKEKMFSVPLSIFLIIVSVFILGNVIVTNEYVNGAIEETKEHDEYFSYRAGSYEFLYAVHPEISGTQNYDVKIVCLDDNGKQCTGVTDCIIDVLYPNETELTVGNMIGPDANGKYNFTLLNSSLATTGYYEYWITCEGATKGGGLNAFIRVEGPNDWEEPLEAQVKNQYKYVIRIAVFLVIMFLLYIAWNIFNWSKDASKQKDPKWD
jgi:hypothetical protein